jgi:hypothetical protein
MRWYRLTYVRGRVFSALADVRSNVHLSPTDSAISQVHLQKQVFLDVEGCVKFFGVVFQGVFAWEKSMLSALGFLIVVEGDAGHYLFGVVDGGVFLG